MQSVTKTLPAFTLNVSSRAFLFVYLCLIPSVTSRIPQNRVIIRKQLAATANSGLVVADCFHVRTCGIEAEAKMFFSV